MRPTTQTELTTQARLTTPDPHASTTFAEFERIYQAAFTALRSRMANLLRVVHEIVADAGADGVVWVQPAPGNRGSSSVSALIKIFGDRVRAGLPAAIQLS